MEIINITNKHPLIACLCLLIGWEQFKFTNKNINQWGVFAKKVEIK